MQPFTLSLGTAAIFLLLGFAVATYFQTDGGRKGFYLECGWFLAFVASIACFRYPFLRVNIEINVDESQMLAQAVRFSRDMLPWRAVDGTTGGPLNSYVLMWPMLFGLWPDYRLSRLTGLILVVLSIACTHFGLRQIIGRGTSLCILSAQVVFYVLATEPDFIHYSSEHLPLALFGAVIFFGISATRTGKPLAYLLAGVFCGALPLAKLQTAPMALVAGITIACASWHQNQKCPSIKWRQVVSLAAGSAILPSMILIPVAIAGYWTDFVIRYIQFSLAYGPARPSPRLATAYALLANGPTATTFLMSAIGGCFFLLCVAVPPLRHRVSVKSALAAIGMWFVTLFCIFKPNQAFPHYLHLLAIPTILVVACFHQFATQAMSRFPNGIRIITMALVAILTVPQFCGYASRNLPHQMYSQWYLGPTLKNDLAEWIRTNQKEGDFLEVWGWSPAYYVLSHSTSATRDAICHAVLCRTRFSEYYIRCHLDDLKQSSPTFFIDALTEASHCPEWPPAAEVRAEVTPAIGDWLQANYSKVAEQPIPGAINPIRVYVRRDRIADLKSP